MGSKELKRNYNNWYEGLSCSIIAAFISIVSSRATKADLKAASPLVNCGCQCSSLVFRDAGNIVQGNCNTVDHTGSQWCYVSLTGPLATSCQDIQPSSRFPGHGWSYEACATPDLVQCASGAIPPIYPPAPLSPPSHVHPILPQPAIAGPLAPQPAFAGLPVNGPAAVGPALQQPPLVAPGVPQPSLVGPAVAAPSPAQPIVPGPQVPFPQWNPVGGVLPDNVRAGLKEDNGDSVHFGGPTK